MPNTSMLSFLGIAKETTPGTPVAPTAFLPVTTFKPVDVIKYLEDKTWRGSMGTDIGEIPGPASSTWDYDGPVYADVIGYPLVSVLGDVTVTGASAPYTTAISLLNSGQGQPPTYTITDYYVINTRQFPGMQFEEVGLKFNADDLLMASIKGCGYPSVTTTKPTSSYSAVKAQANWTGAVTIGGTTSTKLIDGECTIKRNASIINTVDGTQGPRNIWAGPVSVEGKLTLVAEDDTDLTAYLNNTQPSLDINYTAGSGATATQVKLHMTQCAYTAATVERGKDYIEVAATYKAIFNATDAGASGGLSPIKVTLQNASPSGTYK